MSEDDVRPGTDSATARGEGTAFGSRLAAARETAGLSVGDVAARLRLHVNQVRALESGNLTVLPEAAYVRGFVRSYARLLGLDPAPLVEDLNAKLSPPGSVVEGMARTRDYSPVKAAEREQRSRLVVLGLAVIALIALGAIGWYATRQASAPAAAPAPAAASPAPATAPAAAAAGASSDPAAPVPATVAAAEAAVVSIPVEQAVAAEPAPGPAGPLSLSFSGASWVEVTDANGKVLLSQLARAGDVLQPAGAPPFNVVIGDASKATAAVHGQAFNLESVTRANVARFTVK